jgi:hypothetical protein
MYDDGRKFSLSTCVSEQQDALYCLDSRIKIKQNAAPRISPLSVSLQPKPVPRIL